MLSTFLQETKLVRFLTIMHIKHIATTNPPYTYPTTEIFLSKRTKQHFKPCSVSQVCLMHLYTLYETFQDFGFYGLLMVIRSPQMAIAAPTHTSISPPLYPTFKNQTNYPLQCGGRAVKLVIPSWPLGNCMS